jgi:hypothetical protein
MDGEKRYVTFVHTSDDPDNLDYSDVPQAPHMIPEGPAEKLFELLASEPPTAPGRVNAYALILENARKGQKAAINAWRDILASMRLAVSTTAETESTLPVKCSAFTAGALAAEIARRYVEGLKRPAVSKRTRVQPFGDTILYNSDRVTGAMLRFLAAPGDWEKGVINGFDCGRKFAGYKDLAITVGIPSSPETEGLGPSLARSGAILVKAYYALWGRWFENTGGAPGDHIPVSINQFCADLGYARAANGGFKIESKAEAARIVEALAAVEIRATYWPKGKGPAEKDAATYLRGRVWSCLLAERGKALTDFSFAPGPWFGNPVWRQYNEAVGKIGAGLTHLDNRRDEWAILIGGYVGTLIRTRHYKPVPLRVGTILCAIGKASEDTLRRKQRTQDKFERALDRLCTVRVFDHWEYNGTDAAELSDPDDPEEVAAYYGTDATPKGDWLKQCLTITLPKEMDKDRERLDDAQKAARARAPRRRRALPPAKGMGRIGAGKGAGKEA